MKTRYTTVRAIISLVSATFILLLFQNCSSRGFSTMSQLSSEAGSSSTSGSGSSNVIPVANPVAPTLNGKLVPVFVAQGHQARTVMSCDDGASWIHDVSDDSGTPCLNADCDHTATSASGIDYNDGWIFSAYGHGMPGTLRRSQNGYSWEIINTRSVNSSQGVSYVNKTLFLPNGNFGLSFDLGKTLVDNVKSIPSVFNGYFAFGRLARAGSVLFASGNGGSATSGPQGLISQDSGLTWNSVASNSVGWDAGVYIAAGKGRLAMVSTTHLSFSNTSAFVSYSDDNGLTWTGKVVYNGVDYADWSGLWFDGNQFVAFFDNQMWKSLDGISWSSSPLVSPVAWGVTATSIARGPSGTYVSIPNLWNGSYTNQRAYRSTDGLNWTQLDSNHFKGGHPMLRIISAYVDASVCQ